MGLKIEAARDAAAAQDKGSALCILGLEPGPRRLLCGGPGKNIQIRLPFQALSWKTEPSSGDTATANVAGPTPPLGGSVCRASAKLTCMLQSLSCCCSTSAYFAECFHRLSHAVYRSWIILETCAGKLAFNLEACIACFLCSAWL